MEFLVDAFQVAVFLILTVAIVVGLIIITVGIGSMLYEGRPKGARMSRRHGLSNRVPTGASV
jgi:hypothetical protein